MSPGQLERAEPGIRPQTPQSGKGEGAGRGLGSVPANSEQPWAALASGKLPVLLTYSGHTWVSNLTSVQQPGLGKDLSSQGSSRPQQGAVARSHTENWAMTGVWAFLSPGQKLLPSHLWALHWLEEPTLAQEND